jgi:hypothetical protein
MKNSVCTTLALLAVAVSSAAAFSSTSPTTLSRSTSYPTLSMSNEGEPPKKGFFQNFFEELDAFVDDATSRRLGNGAQYYGKRKSSFYGADDSNRKVDKVSWIDDEG